MESRRSSKVGKVLGSLNPFKDEKRRTFVHSKYRQPMLFSKYDRTTANLEKYELYYRSEGMVWAAINLISFNTVMSGYTIESDNKEAKKIIEKFCNDVDLTRYLLKSTQFSLTYGDSFMELVYNKKGKPVRLKGIDPKTMFIEFDVYGDVEHYYQEIDGQKQDLIDRDYICHIKFFHRPDSPYGISLIEPSRDTIHRKVRTDEAIASSIERHGFPKFVLYVGDTDDHPSEDELDKIEKKFENLSHDNEFILSGNCKLEVVDDKGVQGVEEYFGYFQAQGVTGLLCPEEALGLGSGSTEACYDEKTEVLTKRGWVLHKDLKNSDLIATFNPITNMMEYRFSFEPVEKYQYDHDGNMIHFKGRKIDIMVTPNHRMWANKNPTETEENWQFVTAEEIHNSGAQWAIKCKSDYEPLDKIDDKIINTMKFIGYYISDGSINSNGQPYCRLSQKKEQSLDRMRQVIHNFEPRFKESNTDVKGSEFHLYDWNLYNWLKQFGNNCYDRKISREILDMHPVYLEKLLFAAIDGDGTYDTRKGRNTCEYATASEQLADDILEIATKCGFRALKGFSPDKRDNRKGMWRVSIDLSKKDYVLITPRMCHNVNYVGKTYCLNVPNHIYYTRRNGRVAIQGNTANIRQILFERMIKAFQHSLAQMVQREIFAKVLAYYGMEDEYVKIKFKSVTDKDEAMKAKWLSDILKSYGSSKYRPFSINEVRQMFDKEALDDDYADRHDIFGGGVDDDKNDDNESEENGEEVDETEQ
jgi:hypothetical protein